MTTEKEKCFAGQWYDPNDDQDLCNERDTAMLLCEEINQLSSKDGKRPELLKKLFPHNAENAIVMTPFWADYGIYTTIGEGSFVNRNAYFMDEALITIGKNCFIGPNCGLYTANHATHPLERRTGLEIALPITLEDDVWLGGDVTILPGVTIGKGSIIGAKSLVSKDIPPNVIAVGNPCRIVREITDADRVMNK